MRFQVLDIVFNPPHPVTGEAVAPSDRLNRVVETAVLAEELGFDSFAVGSGTRERCCRRRRRCSSARSRRGRRASC